MLMLHAGLDLSRRRLDVCLIGDEGDVVERLAAPPDADGLRHLVERVGPQGRVRGVIESMTGARFVRDTLEELGWEVLVADPHVRAEREQARFRLHLVKHRSMLKHRIHATLITFGHPCPVSDLFGVAGRELLERLAIPEPWRGTVEASLSLIDDLDAEIDLVNRQLRLSGADHPYIPLLLTVPGIGWVLAFTIGAEIGDIHRFATPKKLCGYTGLCPRVNQSGDKDRRGPLTKQGPRYLRWAMLEATMHALRHPAYADRYQATKRRLGKQRGAKVAQIDIARRLTEAVWHMLTRNQPFAPAGATLRLAA